MNKYITFDRLRLSLPLSTIEILQPTMFRSTVSGTGEVIRMKYEQTSPFYYSIEIDEIKRCGIVEFNGKVLLDRYPELINYRNIINCFENINQYKVCYILPSEALAYAVVLQCDVTKDIPCNIPINELQHNMTFRNNKKWCVRDITNNRYTIERTCTTKRKKARMVIYDKAVEMSRKVNEDFLKTVTNHESQLDYFRNKVRYELNLNSIDRIRHFFGLKETKLSNLLNTSSDPIRNFLEEAIVDNQYFENVLNFSGNLRSLEHLLLMAICDFDMHKLEMVIRDLYGSSRSISRTMSPYQDIYTKLGAHVSRSLPNSNLMDMGNDIRKTLLSVFSNVPSHKNILQIYKPYSPSIVDYDYFNLPYIKIPFLPDDC